MSRTVPNHPALLLLSSGPQGHCYELVGDAVGVVDADDVGVGDADGLGVDDVPGEADALGEVELFTGGLVVRTGGGEGRVWCAPGVVAIWSGAVGADIEGAGLLFCACGAAGVVASLSVVWF